MCERCSYGQCIVWIEQSYVDWSRFDDGSECEASSQYTGGKHRDAHTTSDFKVKRKAKCTQQWPMRSRRAYTSILRVKISHELITCKSNFDRKKYYF